MKTIKVIPTIHNGIKYRSRTEARWAVFMTELKFPFVYEPEGFDLGEAGCYIPDFWLPSIDSFLEIKSDIALPGRGSPTEELCFATKKNVITFCGAPNPYHDSENGYLNTLVVAPDSVFWNPSGASEVNGWDCDYWFCCCPHCKRVGIEFNGRADRINCNCPKSNHGDKGYNDDDPFLMNAYYKSRNAFRFI